VSQDNYVIPTTHHYDTPLMALVLPFVHTGRVLGLILAMLLRPHPRINPGMCLHSQRKAL